MDAVVAIRFHSDELTTIHSAYLVARANASTAMLASVLRDMLAGELVDANALRFADQCLTRLSADSPSNTAAVQQAHTIIRQALTRCTRRVR